MKKLIVTVALLSILIAGLAVVVAQQPELSLEITGVNTTGFPEVLITANVYDALGQPVPALTAESFSLQGDLAVYCPIRDTENISDDNLSFSTVLVIDVSDSMGGTPLELAKAAARRYVESLRPGDTVALIAFASQVEQVLDYTDDRDAILAAIDGLQISGRTALYQAAHDGIQLGAGSPQPRRAMILLSDGSEYGGLSRVTPEEVAAAAIVNGVPVYTIGLGYGADRSFLETISFVTNAEYYESPTPEELEAIYDSLGTLLTSQYVITLECDLPADGSVYPLILSVESGDASASAQSLLRVPVPVPVVRVTLPDTPIDAPTTITAEVLADDALQSVVFSIDGEPVAEFTESPFSIEIDPYAFTPGTHTIEVVATDEDGESGVYEAEFEVADLPVQVHVAGLEAGQSLNDDTPIEITFTSQTPVNHVAILLDGIDLAHLVEEPWTINLRPLRYAPGEHTLLIAADTADGQHGELTLNFDFSNAPYQTATALAPTATQTPSSTPNLTGTANAVALTTVPLTSTADALFTAMTGTAQTNTEATGTAVANASATFSAIQQSTSAAATRNANDAAATANAAEEATASAATQSAIDSSATAGAQEQATASAATQSAVNSSSTASAATQNAADAQSTSAAAGTQQSQQSQTAVAQASATGVAVALAATSESQAQATATAEAEASATAAEQTSAAATSAAVAITATAESQERATATAEVQASQQAAEETGVAATANAAILATSTADARATSNAEVRLQMQNATRDALATSNAQARQIAQQTSDARATSRVVQTATAESRATGTVSARETALFASNATGTALANNIATTTAQARLTATRVALETAVAEQQQTIDAGSTSTAQAQATGTAEAEAAGTATAQALAFTATAVFEETLSARNTVAAIGQGTATAEAQQTLDTRLAAIGTTTAESTPEATEVAAQPTTRLTATAQPTLVPVEAEPQAADAGSSSLLAILLVLILLAVVVTLVVVARRRSRMRPRR